MISFTLSQWAMGLGALIVLVNATTLAMPDVFVRWARAFPRNRWAGWLLTAIDLLWVCIVILHAPLGRFENLKPAIYLTGPVAFLLIVTFMDELLAPRALGGLLLLLGNPILNAARWHPSNWRLVLTMLVYMWVIVGIVLMMSPYWLRDAIQWVTASRGRLRLVCSVRLMLGFAILILAWKVY